MDLLVMGGCCGKEQGSMEKGVERRRLHIRCQWGQFGIRGERGFLWGPVIDR